METNNQYQNQFNDNEESGFDLQTWLFLFLRHWYLFVIFIILALGLGYLKNKSWTENYETAGTIIIDEARSSYSNNTFMQGFGVQSSFRSIDNQLMIMKSYDLISKVVDSIPFLNVDYISKGRFKTRNLYKTTPIEISTDYVNPKIYGVLFKINLQSDGSYTITESSEKKLPDFKVNGHLGIPIQHNLFFLTINPTGNTNINREMYFRFRSKGSLISDFMSRLRPYIIDGSSILSVSLQSETPDRDIDFINKLFDVFMAENLERKNDAATKTINFIDQQLDDVSQSLAISEGAMTEFRKSNQIVDLSSHSSEVLTRATQYDEQKARLRLRETYLNYLENYLKTNLEAGAVIAPSNFELNEPVLMSMVQQFNDVITTKNETSKKHPLYGKYEREIANFKVSINEVIKNIRASMDIEQKDINSKLSNIQRDISGLPAKEMQLIGIERKYRVDDNYYTYFLQKRAEAAIQKASNRPDNNILDKARVVALTNGDTKAKTAMTYLLLGALIPILIVVIKELLNNTIRDAKDVEKNSPFPMIGVIKHTNNTSPVLAANNPRSGFTEMFRVIRTRIEFIAQKKKDITILITSAESGDGKTYFSTNLASVYGMTGLKTLLIDMDIRKPSIKDRLEIKSNLGVTDYLISDKSLEEMIIKKEGINYDILLAGAVPPNPGELIRSEKLKNMFTTLRKMYDFIIVDTSPIGLVADSYSLTPMMDANLFVVRSQKTNKSFFKRLSAQIKADNLNRFYIILNDANTTGPAYGRYASGYGYGHAYGYIKHRKRSNQYIQYYEDDSEI